jgi:hypothetical protein
MPFSVHLATLLGVVYGALASPVARDTQASAAIASISSAQWKALNQSVGGHLFVQRPLATSCYSFYNGTAQSPQVAQCSAVQSGYTDESYIASTPSGYMNVSLENKMCPGITVRILKCLRPTGAFAKGRDVPVASTSTYHPIRCILPLQLTAIKDQCPAITSISGRFLTCRPSSISLNPMVFLW